MSNPLLIKNYVAAAAVLPYRIVAFGATEGEVQQAAAATNPMCGITGQLGAEATGDRIDVTKVGRALVTFGGTVSQGNPLTSDATGRAILAAPAAGVMVRIIGYAEQNAVAGDIADCLISIGQMTGV